MVKEKLSWSPPELKVYGNVVDITRSAFVVGSGDLWMEQNHLPDVLGSS